MKVLHFYKTYFPDSTGGVPQAIKQISSATSKLGVEVQVLALSEKKKKFFLNFDDHTAHFVPSICTIASNPISTRVFSAFYKLVKTVDLIHYHFPWPMMDVVHFATRVKKPTLLTYHSDIVKQKYLLKIYRPLKMRLLNDVDHIVATSPHYAASSQVLLKFKHKTSIIPLGINKDSYPKLNLERLAYWQRRFGNKFFLFIGVLRYYKGLHILMEAAVGQNYPIIIAGSGPIEQELKAQAAKLKLNNVFFLGHVSDEDKIALINLCYCVLFPSHLRSEAFGISLVESAMCAKPMICSEIGTGTTFINIDKLTGLVVPPSNANALRTAMCYLWENPEQAQRMGQNAEQRYWSNFTADKMAYDYVSLYERLLV